MRLKSAIVVAGLAFAGTGSPALAMDLASGTAIYELSLDPSKGMAGVGGTLSGRMEVGLFKVCEGYDTVTRLDARIMPATGGMVMMKLDSDLHETRDALKFKVAGRFGLQVLANTTGEARLTDDGVSVKLTTPEAAELALDGGPVLFPMAFVTRAIEAAKAGERLVSVQVFDGSVRDLWTVSVAIGDPRSVDESEDEKEFAEALGIRDMRRWPMTFSYFPPAAGEDAVPAFATGGVVYENGATLGATYDFTHFVMKLSLVEYRPAAAKGCE